MNLNTILSEAIHNKVVILDQRGEGFNRDRGYIIPLDNNAIRIDLATNKLSEALSLALKQILNKATYGVMTSIYAKEGFLHIGLVEYYTDYDTALYLRNKRHATWFIDCYDNAISREVA